MIKCMTHHKVTTTILFSERQGFAYRGVCIPPDTLQDLDIVTDLQGCCVTPNVERELITDYEITLKVSDPVFAPPPLEPVVMVKFNTFKSMDV